MTTLLAVQHAEIRYQQTIAVKDISFHVSQGALISLLGPSGCGKTTLLRAIAGFEPLSRGEILLAQRILSRPGFTLPPEQRRIGMVFQDYALFPHMNVAQNICFGLRKQAKKQQGVIADQLLELVGLVGMGGRFPHELSGGQQQRVALARALAPQPELILMDEPFSNLDVELRERLSVEVREILKQQQITGILVTHDQNEAFAMADQIGVIHQGTLQQWDTPFNLYHEPANRFIADFVGKGVLLPGTLAAPDAIHTEAGILQGNRAYQWSKGTPVDLLIRPDDVVHDADSPLRGQVIHKAFKGAEVLYTLQLPTGSTVLSLFPSHLDYQLNDSVGIRFAMEHIVAFQAGQ